MGIMSLALGSGVTVTLSADGHDEKEAVSRLVTFLQKSEV